MKVLHVITGLNEGGAEGAMTRLITADSQNRHQVISLTGQGKYGSVLQNSGVELTLLDIGAPSQIPRGLAEIFRTIRGVRPDVVQTWMYHSDLIGGVLARLAGAKAVVWNLRNEVSCDWSARTRMIVRLNAILSRHVPSRIVACSEEAASSHRAAGYNGATMAVIGNGIDLTRFGPDETARRTIRVSFGLSAEEFVIGRVGRFAAQKDYATLFAALAHVDPFIRLLLVGRGMESGNREIENLADAAGVRDRIILAGPRNNVSDFMNAMDLHVSSSRVEGFPNVLSEAMSCGVPCAATAVGASALIVGMTGWIVPVGDPQSLASAINEAAREKAKSPSDWDLRRENAMKRVRENFAMDTMVARYRDLWNQVAAVTKW